MHVGWKPSKDQLVRVTGASGGIGLVTARIAADRGAKVLASARDEAALRALVEEIEA